MLKDFFSILLLGLKVERIIVSFTYWKKGGCKVEPQGSVGGSNARLSRDTCYEPRLVVMCFVTSQRAHSETCRDACDLDKWLSDLSIVCGL